jgi:hypothetical protein
VRKKRKLPPFVALSRTTMKSKEWRTGLTSTEKIIYWCLKYKYVGHNNGQIRLYYSELEDMFSPGTISRANRGLEEKGWIVRTKLGGLYRYFNEYKLTGKYDDALLSYDF